MKVNYKQLFLNLVQQKKALESVLNKDVKVNEVPSDFNQVGWSVTVQKVEEMLEKLKQLESMKGNLLTPQFYRSIFNRALIAINESDKLIEKITLQTSDIDYEKEVIRLNEEIVELQKQVIESKQLEANL